MGKVLTMRERMEQHRKNPVCAACHAGMDPLGFALENYDAVGHWRDTIDQTPIDASGNLTDGANFEGVDGLRQALLVAPVVVGAHVGVDQGAGEVELGIGPGVGKQLIHRALALARRKAHEEGNSLGAAKYFAGGPLREGDVVESQQKLYNLGIFNRVTIEPQNANGSDPEKDVVVLVEEAKHPTLEGEPPSFVIGNEEWCTYDKSPRPDVHGLATVDESAYSPETKTKMKGDHPVIWCNEHVKARNIYIFMGHHPELFENPAFTKIFSNSILWAANQ